MAAADVGLPSAGRERRLVQTVLVVVFVQSVGGSAIIPLLPTYLAAHGSTPALVGVVMGAYFLASVATQYPVGRITDRVGPAIVIGGGLVVFGIGCVGFALSSGAVEAVGYRALQGVGAGAVALAGAAAIGAQVPREERGSAFAALNAARMFAFAVGPLVGSAIGASSMRALFLLAALLSFIALPFLVRIPTSTIDHAAHPAVSDGVATADVRRTAALVGAALVFAGAGLVNGLYESCWSLLLHARHVPSIAIGLSWTLYCFPFALLSRLSGRLADRSDRRVLAVAGTVATASFAAIYPLIGSVALLVGLGCLEAVGAVMVTPAALSILSDAVPGRAQGAAQGVVQTAWTAATALAAMACGALFGVARSLPFELVACGLAVTGALVAWSWRSVPGHVGSKRGVDEAAPSMDGDEMIIPPTPLL